MSTSLPRTKVLYIGGLSRSGTTLLERLLGQLPGALPLGEVAHLWDRGIRRDESCGCGSAFSSCEFWHRIGASAFGGWGRVDLDRIDMLRTTVDRTRHVPGLASRRLNRSHADLVTEYATHYQRVYAAAAADSRARLIIDSSKHPSLAYCLRRHPQIDLRIVHVVRDSRAVAESWRRQPARPESDTADTGRHSTTRAALLWNAQNAAFGMLRRRGTPVHRVHYEDVIADPRGVVTRLARWAGVAVDDDRLRYIGDGWIDVGPSHSVAGDPLRFTVGRLHLDPDETSTEPARRRLVGTLTMPLLNRYGYLSKAEPEPSAPVPVIAPPRRAADDTIGTPPNDETEIGSRARISPGTAASLTYPETPQLDMME